MRNPIVRLIAMGSFAALLLSPSLGWAQSAPDLGTAANFAVLGDTVTCVGPGSITGDVGASTTFTPGACVFDGATPPAVTSSAAVVAQFDFTNAYNTIRDGDCTPLTLDNTGTTVGRNISTLAGVTLTPGTYCIDDVAKTGLLTLNGPSNGVWIFKTLQFAAGDLTGTNFSVVMTGGGLPCNVFWAPATAATMTTSVFKGNILAGNLTVGSITTTGGNLIGRALANVAVSMTGPNVVGCGALEAMAGCKEKKLKHERCNQGVGNGPEDCDPGNSNQGDDDRSNDERGGTPGKPGRHGGNGK